MKNTHKMFSYCHFVLENDILNQHKILKMKLLFLRSLDPWCNIYFSFCFTKDFRKSKTLRRRSYNLVIISKNSIIKNKKPASLEGPLQSLSFAIKASQKHINLSNIPLLFWKSRKKAKHLFLFLSLYFTSSSFSPVCYFLKFSLSTNSAFENCPKSCLWKNLQKPLHSMTDSGISKFFKERGGSRVGYNAGLSRRRSRVQVPSIPPFFVLLLSQNSPLFSFSIASKILLWYH